MLAETARADVARYTDALRAPLTFAAGSERGVVLLAPSDDRDHARVR